MGINRIHIENLGIRFPRGTNQNAQKIAGNIGHEIIQSLAGTAKGKTGKMRIDEIVIGKVDRAAIPKIGQLVAAEVKKLGEVK